MRCGFDERDAPGQVDHPEQRAIGETPKKRTAQVHGDRAATAAGTTTHEEAEPPVRATRTRGKMTKQGVAQSRQSGTETEERIQKGQEGEVFTDAGDTNLNISTTGMTQKGSRKVPNTVYLVFSDIFQVQVQTKRSCRRCGLVAKATMIVPPATDGGSFIARLPDDVSV